VRGTDGSAPGRYAPAATLPEFGTRRGKQLLTGVLDGYPADAQSASTKHLPPARSRSDASCPQLASCSAVLIGMGSVGTLGALALLAAVVPAPGQARAGCSE
jgi:hypothetical protein